MARPEFEDWPEFKDEPRKPFDRLAPFHRIQIPKNHFQPPQKIPDDLRRFVPRQNLISGDGYGMGARSPKDYDAKFGEDLGKELAEFLEDIFPLLKGPRLLSKGLSQLIKGIPGLGNLAKPLTDFLDGFDPFAELFKFFGSRLDALLVDSFVRGIPAWVPTFDDKLHPEIQILETDGIVILSHQRYDSMPFWQWHRFYDWRFALEPSPLFQEIVGFGNLRRDDANENLEEKRKTGPNKEDFKFVPYHHESFSVTNTTASPPFVDCEWDIGAIGAPPGPFFATAAAKSSPDWCWPMAGMFMWAIGRSVYDCQHATADGGRRTKKADRKPVSTRPSEAELLKRGVHMNQLHPLKAIATSRWEAFQFKENPQPVPAIQFMFFTNRQVSSAGFFERPIPTDDSPAKCGFKLINDENYDFIVDLPTAELLAKVEYPIGHTPEFALNTIVLQPRLVIDADFVRFKNAGAVMEDEDDRSKNEPSIAQGPKPKVELIDPKPGESQRQAHVTFPLKEMSGDFDSYGVLLSMGWLDPDGVQARRVKKVTVRLLALQPAKDLHEDVLGGNAEWVINFGVNGRWFNFRIDIDKPRRLDLKVDGKTPEVEMLLAEDDFILVSVHGMEEDPFGAVFKDPPEFRSPQKRPVKDPPTVTLANASKEAKAALIKLFMNDRILRHHGDVKVPTGPPDLRKGGAVPTKTISVPMIGREIEWDRDIDTDDDHQASLVARAMFLRVLATNALDANDLLGMINPQMRDPARKDPTKSRKRSQDITDTPNPLLVKDVLKEVGSGGTKQCELSAYATDVVGRMGTIAYDPEVLDYKVFYEIKVEDLPEKAAPPEAGN